MKVGLKADYNCSLNTSSGVVLQHPQSATMLRGLPGPLPLPYGRHRASLAPGGRFRDQQSPEGHKPEVGAVRRPPCPKAATIMLRVRCPGRILSSAGILAKQVAESLRTGRTRGREFARVSSRVSHRQHRTGRWMPITLPTGHPHLL